SAPGSGSPRRQRSHSALSLTARAFSSAVATRLPSTTMPGPRVISRKPAVRIFLVGRQRHRPLRKIKSLIRSLPSVQTGRSLCEYVSSVARLAGARQLLDVRACMHPRIDRNEIVVCSGWVGSRDPTREQLLSDLTEGVECEPETACRFMGGHVAGV